MEYPDLPLLYGGVVARLCWNSGGHILPGEPVSVASDNSVELRLVKTPDQEMSFCSFNVTIQVSLEGYSAVSLGLRRARPGETLLASRSSLLAEHLHERDGGPPAG